MYKKKRRRGERERREEGWRTNLFFRILKLLSSDWPYMIVGLGFLFGRLLLAIYLPYPLCLVWFEGGKVRQSTIFYSLYKFFLTHSEILRRAHHRKFPPK